MLQVDDPAAGGLPRTRHRAGTPALRPRPRGSTATGPPITRIGDGSPSGLVHDTTVGPPFGASGPHPAGITPSPARPPTAEEAPDVP
jgi:hypothetical protein